MVAKKGPPSALETKTADPVPADEAKGMDYDVQVHTAEHGLEVKRYRAETGDEAAAKALAANGYKDVSIRGVTPATDPDRNSLGGERDAQQMLNNASNSGAIINTLGTEANADASEKLGRADIDELKD